MFAFKVVATTLQMLLMGLVFISGLKVKEKATKRTCCIMLLICAMSVIAIWG